jgi:translation initiation factor 1
MSGLFAGTPWERPVTCESCERPTSECTCPRGEAGNVVLPKDQPVRISREKRGGGKVVTVVRGLDPAATDLGEMLRRLKSHCAAGGTIDGSTLEIQGDHRQKLLDRIRALGYPTKLAGG